MKKFDIKKAAMVSIFLMGVLFVFIIGAMIYGARILYDFNSGLPGTLALVIVGVWAIYDFTSMLNRWAMKYLHEMDLAKEDDK